MERADDGERHDDDELASALEEQVAAITSAIPIMAGPTVVSPDAAALTDDEVAALVGADLDSHDTLAAIDHLQTVLEARAMRSRPGLGIVKFRHEVENQRGELVCLTENSVIFGMRNSPEAGA